MSCPLITSQMRASPSALEVASQLPAGLKAALVTGAVSPLST